jgi:hypothetical protein
VSLIVENLKRSVEERLERLTAFQSFIEEMRVARTSSDR